MNLFGSPNIERMAAEHDYDGLYQCLQHRDSTIRLEAAQALAEMNDGTGWRFLFDTLKQSTDIEEKEIVAEILGALGHPRAVPALGEALYRTRYEPAADVQFAEALRNALEAIGGPEAEEALRKAGYEPVIPRLSHEVTEYDAHYVRPVLPVTSEIHFHTAEEHLDSAVELRESEHAERGLVEDSLALWLRSDWGYAWYLRGVLYEDLDRSFEALLAYRQAVSLQPDLKEAREALQELEAGPDSAAEDSAYLLAHLTSRDWRDRRDAVAGLAGLAPRLGSRARAFIDQLFPLLQDEEREVRHAAITALGQLGDPSSVPHLVALEESSWLVRFAIIEALSNLRSVDGLMTYLRSQMNQIQERNPVFSNLKDPLLEVEYDALMEIGVRALERTDDLEALLAQAEENTWEVVEDEESDEEEFSGGESYYRLDEGEEAPGDSDDEDLEEDEDLTSYVDEAAEMVSVALERLANARMTQLDNTALQRLAVVPDLTLIDMTAENPEPVVVHDLTVLREAARAEAARRR